MPAFYIRIIITFVATFVAVLNINEIIASMNVRLGLVHVNYILDTICVIRP